MKQIACLQHVPFEGPAYISTWAATNDIALDIYPLHQGVALPSDADFDGLIVLGGTMNVNDHDDYGHLEGEMDLIRVAHAAEIPILGICLGAQLIAAAFGAPVTQGKREIGWFPVQKTAEANHESLFRDLPAEFIPLHWHGDHAHLPEGAVRLATSPICANQAFQLGDRTLGVQFHLEATVDSVTVLVANDGASIRGSTYEQSADEIRNGTATHGGAANELAVSVLDALFRPEAPRKTSGTSAAAAVSSDAAHASQATPSGEG